MEKIEDKDVREAVRARLAEIEKANGGVLRPTDVVNDAVRTSSPLHDYFQWDDKEAAKAHRLKQARVLITSVKINVSTKTTKIESVFYVRDPEAKHAEQGYVSINKIRTDKDLSRARLAFERAKNMSKIFNMEKTVDDLIDRTVSARQVVQEAQA